MTEERKIPEFGGGTADSSNPFFELARGYENVNEILNDPHLEVLARIADMQRDDLANILIKTMLIQRGLLDQPVTVSIDGKNVVLEHPEDGKPLTYGDLLADRSGPLFAGYLNARAGAEMIATDQESLRKKQELVAAHLETTVAACMVAGIGLPSAERIEQAAGIFARAHQAQRKLSDYDITLADPDTLYKVFGGAIKTAAGNNGLEISDEFAMEVAKTHWQQGGAVDTHIAHAAYAEKENYAAVAAQLGVIVEATDKKFTHMLLEGPGEAMRQLSGEGYEKRADATYGLGVNFYAPEVSIGANGKLIADGTPKETGDVICDAASDNAHGISVSSAIRNTREKIEQALPEGEFGRLLASSNELTYRLRFEKALEASAERGNPSITEIAASYENDVRLAISLRIAEETGKKLAQNGKFRLQADGNDEPNKIEYGRGKFIGNVSDIAPFLSGMQAKIEECGPDAEHYQILQQQAALSLLINSARWGVDIEDRAGEGAHTRFSDIGRTPDSLPAEKGADGISAFARELQTSINARSYGNPDNGEQSIRRQLGWRDISVEEAQKRCDQFERGSAPVYEKVRSQEHYFKLVNGLKEAVGAYQEAAAIAIGNGDISADARKQAERAEKEMLSAIVVIRDEIKKHLKAVVQQDMPQLYEKAVAMSADGGKSYFDHLTNQVQDAAAFCLRREELERERDLERGKLRQSAQNIVPPDLRSVTRTTGDDLPEVVLHEDVAAAIRIMSTAGVKFVDGDSPKVMKPAANHENERRASIEELFVRQ